MPDSQLNSQINWSPNSQPMSSVAGGVVPQDIMGGLGRQREAINDELLKSLPAALTQIAQKSAPSAQLPTVKPYQDQQQDNTQKVGAEASRRQGVSNAFKSVRNLVGQYSQKKQEEQVKTLSLDIQRIMEAQDGISQAKQTLAQDPNNEDAKKTIQKNMDIINSQLSDPKKRKQIGKAFDIDFLDPSKNNKPEHQALKDATKSYAEQMEDKTPTKMVPNVQAIAKVQALQAQQKAIDDQIKAVTPLAVANTKLQGELAIKEAELTERGREADQREFQQNKRTAATLQEHYDAAMDSAKLRNDGAMARTITAGNMAYKRTMDSVNARETAIKTRGLTGSKADQILQGNYKMLDSSLKSANQQILQLETLRDAKGVSKETKEKYNSSIRYWENLQQSYQDKLTSISDKLTKSGAGLPNDSSNSTGSSSSGSTTNTRTEVKIIGADAEDTADTNSEDY